MIEASQSPDPLFRAAMAWCFGFIRDERCIPLLEGLLKDPSIVVRKRAERSLAQTLTPLGRTDHEASPQQDHASASSYDAAATAAPSSQ
jgi:HEAT repeat protein